jgi:hypothetical protein
MDERLSRGDEQWTNNCHVGTNDGRTIVTWGRTMDEHLSCGDEQCTRMVKWSETSPRTSWSDSKSLLELCTRLYRHLITNECIYSFLQDEFRASVKLASESRISRSLLFFEAHSFHRNRSSTTSVTNDFVWSTYIACDSPSLVLSASSFMWPRIQEKMRSKSVFHPPWHSRSPVWAETSNVKTACLQ